MMPVEFGFLWPFELLSLGRAGFLFGPICVRTAAFLLVFFFTFCFLIL